MATTSPASATQGSNQPTTWGYLKDMFAWIQNPSIPMYGRWAHAAQNEGGVDLASAGGTPVYALATGPVLGAANFWHNPPNVLEPLGGKPGYGVVSTRINVPGVGTEDLYYQHIDIAPGIKQGMIVQKGQLLGYIHPGVNELELGFNANWGMPWGTNHPGPWITDPRPWLKVLIQDTSPSIAPDGSTGSGGFNPLDPLGSFWSMAEPTLKTWGEYIALFLIATTLILVGFFLLAEKETMQTVKKVIPV